MKPHVIRSLTTVLLVTLLAYSNVRAQFTLGAEIRPRTEYRHGYKKLLDTAQHAAVYTEQRTRLTLDYSLSKVSVSISVQDVRTWGSQAQLNKTDGLLSLHLAWGEYRFSNKLSAKIGRQELVYDDERLLGNVNWSAQGRSHDLVLLKFRDSTLTIHAGAAYNQDSEQVTSAPYTVPGNYKEMQFLWMRKQVAGINASFLFFNNGLQSPVSVNSTRYSHTTGTFLECRKGRINSNGKAYYQFGIDGNKQEISAWMAGIEITGSTPKNHSVGLGAEVLSGQSNTDTSSSYRKVNHAFNPLYGTAHKFNGFMDYFYSGNHIGSAGLIDIYVKAIFRLKKEKLSIGADVHCFSAQAPVLDIDVFEEEGNYVSMNPYLGTEADITMNYVLSRELVLQLGYSQMFATETMEALKGGDISRIQNWAYVQFLFKPALIK